MKKGVKIFIIVLVLILVAAAIKAFLLLRFLTFSLWHTH